MSGGLFGGARGGDASTAMSHMSLNSNERPGGAPGGGGQNPGGGGGSLRRTLSTPKDFPRLLELTPEQLGELLTDKEAFARFLHGTEGALEARAFTRDLRLEIEGMARANIEMAEEAADIRSQISVIRAVDMKPVREEYEAVKARADALVGRYNLPDLLKAMKDRAAATDAESEEVNEAWLDGKMSAEEFVERYRKLRESHHVDVVKASIVEPNLPGGRGNVARGPPPPPPPTHGYGRPRY